MIKDCEAKKIDFIVTKSISRISRNTADCLEIVRKLLELNIPIYFEKENINTSSMESELFLSILSSMAENESVSISQNAKWSIQKRFQNGTYKIASPPYGYYWNGSEMLINEVEANIVRFIFKEVINGKGCTKIAKILNSKGIPTRKESRWTSTTIYGMLSNEKYTGDVIFQKTYTDENFKRHQNRGEKGKYMMGEHHESIISREDFETAKLLISQRSKEKGIIKGSDKYSQRYAFSGKIICGECKNTFKRRTHCSKTSKYIAWCCNTHLLNKDDCSMLYIRDKAIKAVFINLMNRLMLNHQTILKPCLENLKPINKNSKIITDDMFRLKQTSKLLQFIQKSKPLETFDDNTFNKFIERIIVTSRTEIVFEFKCGLILTGNEET